MNLLEAIDSLWSLDPEATDVHAIRLVIVELEQLQAEVERLRREYRELTCAVWACPVEEGTEATHAETVEEAIRDTLRAVAAETEVQRLRVIASAARADLWYVMSVTGYWHEDFMHIADARAHHDAETAKLLKAAEAAGGE